MLMALVLAALWGYVLGSLPVAVWAGRLMRGVDVREHGSRNAGATNVYRVLGWRPALVVLLLDLSKGLAAAYFAPRLFDPSSLDPVYLEIAAGVTAILGHCYPVFAGFRGGKGVATAGGMVLAIFPLIFPWCLSVFILVLWWTRYASLASMTAVLTLPIGLALAQWLLERNVPQPFWYFSLGVAAFIAYTHRANLARLIKGEEGKIMRQ